MGSIARICAFKLYFTNTNLLAVIKIEKYIGKISCQKIVPNPHFGELDIVLYNIVFYSSELDIVL